MRSLTLAALFIALAIFCAGMRGRAEQQSIAPLTPNPAIPAFRSLHPENGDTPATSTFSGERWPSEFLAPFNFYSTDPATVAVTLRLMTLGRTNDTDPTHQIIIHVPRAAIVFADYYVPGKTPRLPDAITTDQLQVAIVAPDGDPLSIAAIKIARSANIHRAAAIKMLRPQEFIADLNYTKPGWEKRVRESWTKLHRFVDEFDGLRHAPGDLYAGEAGIDEFVEMQCTVNPNPAALCTAEMLVMPALVARIRFPDFRQNGGRGYANSRVGEFRRFACRYLEPPC